MALQNRSVGRQVVYLIAAFVIVLGALLLIAAH